MLNRKHSLTNIFVSHNHDDDDQKSTSEQRRRRASVSANPWMNRIKPFFNGSKTEVIPEYTDRVRFIRESCKTFADLWKSDKDFLNRSVDNDISKAFRELRLNDPARAYPPSSNKNESLPILSSTIDDLIKIHEYIDERRREWLDKIRAIGEKAREKQSQIRQTMSEPRDTYERATRKFETADANFKKSQTRSDRTTDPNHEEKSRELEDIRTDCDQARNLARDTYKTETYRIASEEHSITRHFFAQFLFEEQSFYNNIQQYLSEQVPEVERRLEKDRFAPSFHSDLADHCLNRIERPIAYPIETCIRLLQNSVREEGIFRIAPSHAKQKKLVAELDLQIINEKSKLTDLGYDAHVAASTLKQYLRELPDCLLTHALLPQWNEVPSLSSEEARVQRIGQLINQLPKVNYDNLCYLIRFLSRIAEYSSENKMTPSNLGICVGCSLLYPKEQSSNSYTNSSNIVELMIIHSKELFPEDTQQDPQIPSYHPQPDVIPTLFQSKNRSKSTENLLDIKPTTEFSQPSPKSSGKHRAPPPPPIPQGVLIQIEPTNIGETSTEQFLSEQTTVPPSPTSNTTEKGRRFSGSAVAVLDRSTGSQHRQKASISNKEHELSSPKEEQDILLNSPTSSGAKSMTDLNTRLSNSGQTNNNRISSRRDNTPTSPPGEITQF